MTRLDRIFYGTNFAIYKLMTHKLRLLLLVWCLGLFSPSVFSQNGDSEKKLFTSPLQRLINTHAGFLNLTVLSPAELNQIENYTRTLGIDWSFELDGCDQRARMVAYGLSEEMGVRVGMIKAISPIDVTSQFIAHAPTISWGYHKAAFVQMEQNYYVIDYSLFDQIVPMSEWLRFLGIEDTDIESKIEFENRFSVSTQTEQSWITGWQEWDVESFQSLRQFYPKFEHSNLPQNPSLMQALWPEIQNHEFRKVHISEVHSFWGEPYLLTNDQREALLNGSRCVANRAGGLSQCTSYLQIGHQTCYFQSQVNESTLSLVQIDNDLVCF